MAYVDLEKLLEQTSGSVYKLVILGAKRALEITDGQPKLIDATTSAKPSTIALEEIAKGKVHYKAVKK